MQNLIVWKKAYCLVREVYSVTQKFPKSEQFSLTQQIRRSAISIISNITEGYYRNSNKQFNYFVTVAQGSCGELAVQLLLSKDFEYITQQEYEQLETTLTEISKMLYGLSQKLSRK